MVHKAFILLEIGTGKTKDVLKHLQKINGLKTLDIVTGPYDVIAVLEKEDLNELRQIIAEKIHFMEGVRRVVSCMSFQLTLSDETVDMPPIVRVPVSAKVGIR